MMIKMMKGLINSNTYRVSKFIRLKRNNIVSLSTAQIALHPQLLYDHRLLKINVYDFKRAYYIPKKKGVNFRDLAGVLASDDNKVKWDPLVKKLLMQSRKPLVANYAMTIVRGTSPKPFGRL
ncbi:hypothetical protein Dsin_032098 [Dipteronia sinensis]|uniref:Uncharacterized protein n=1 Tax=Dipteronia sinensis TaxID=43782 RepID=A0AAD9ZMP2_9ROSI|nr:hypothetical protein Dsin_032098 [Dipteronia sinensis]